MDYICLAAGQGTRFGELGRYLQKCMYPLGLTPFVEASVRNLRRSGALDPERDRLAFVVGHHGEQIVRYFGDAYEGLPIVYVAQAEARGTGHAVWLAARALRCREAAVTWLADLYVTTELFERVARHPDPNAITVAPTGADANDDVRVTLADDGRVEQVWRGAQPLSDIGLWKLEPAVMAAMTATATDEVRALPNLQRALERGARVGSVRADEWLHLGGTEPTPEENVRRVVARALELEARTTERTERTAGARGP